MIKLIDNYVVNVDDLNFTLAVDTGRKDKKTGRPVLRPISYHSSLEKAVSACRREYLRKGLENRSFDLHRAVIAMREMDARFNKLLSQAMRGGQP